jgi:hypothetical protein
MWTSVVAVLLSCLLIAYVTPDVAPTRTVLFDNIYKGSCPGQAGCWQPTNNKYACLNNYPGNFDNGISTFQDFLGNGQGVGSASEIDIAIIGTTGCDTLGNRDFEWFLNGQSLGKTVYDAKKDDCSCTDPCDPIPPSISATGNIPYNFSGLNQISVTVDTSGGEDGCYYEYQFNLTYSLGPPLLCCLYNATNGDFQKTFCSPNSQCPTLQDFTNTGSGIVKTCNDCNTLPVCCLYQSATNSSITTSQCLGPLQRCPSMSGYLLDASFQIQDCSFCQFTN